MSPGVEEESDMRTIASLSGIILVLLYHFLAGGFAEDILSMSMVVIIPLVGLLVSVAILGWPTKWGDRLFWTFVAYFPSPILLNGVSLLLGWAGYETIGRYVFEGRYLLLLLPLLYMLCATVAGIVADLLGQRPNGSALRS